MPQQRCVIIAGGSRSESLLKEIHLGDYLIGADRGALFLVDHGFHPDLAVGDFDSVTKAELQVIRENSKEILNFDPVMKDWTDTELAFRKALERSPSEVLMMGVLGSRWDHSLANVHLLRQALDQNVPCKIIDDHNEIILIDRLTAVTKDHFTHISLLPFTEVVNGITLIGFQYPLTNATLQMGQSLGISNVLIGKKGSIAVGQGQLLVIKSMD